MSATPPTPHERAVELRERAATVANRLADAADFFASHLEWAAATRGDSDRRLRLARTEREIARIERENANRWRSGDSQMTHPPKLPVEDDGDLRS